MTAPRIFDFAPLARHRERARRLNGDRFLARDAAESLLERLRATNRQFENAFALDTPDAAFDILEPAALHWTWATMGEREALPLENEAYDLAVSVLALDAVNDLPGVLHQIRTKLKPDGLFLGALFGGETLRELREAFAAAEIETTGGISPRVAPFADVRDLGGLLQRAGFALPVADVERTTVNYRDFSSLLRDLRAHGQTNALVQRSRKFLRRETFAALLASYRPVRATFDIVYLTGWAPHESQQKPLKPGSAKTRLADALGTVERSAGEKPSPFDKLRVKE